CASYSNYWYFDVW
nr:immunoglobulin heavy chain junction region [Mus musculus]MBK4188004.1 immunoglobulin heavy chain junction region [Mus musculus]